MRIRSAANCLPPVETRSVRFPGNSRRSDRRWPGIVGRWPGASRRRKSFAPGWGRPTKSGWATRAISRRKRLWSPADALKCDRGKEGRLRDADLRVRLRHRAFRGSDIGAAFQKLGGNAQRNGGRIALKSLWEAQKSTRLADQKRDRMFVLRRRTPDWCPALRWLSIGTRLAPPLRRCRSRLCTTSSVSSSASW